MAKSKRQALYPLPIDTLFHDPRFIAAPSAAVGMLFRLFEHFWKTECRPLPRDDDQLFAIARAHRPTWRTHRALILALFETCKPELEGYHAQRVGGYKGVKIAALLGGQKAQAKRRAADLAKSNSAPQAPAYASGILPVRAPQPDQERPPQPAQRPARKRLSDKAA